MRTTGTVKWFNYSKGYGILDTEGVNQDCFFHYTAISG
ncbi:MAG: cold-shock protein, partial [Gammaproteobacteria bacterium]|nr:cold-shock protein [Gammaproteobacteria bacterium]